MIQPFISIVIPLYNNESLITRCVHSILAQPFKNIEIVIIDDGSSDNSYQTASALSAEHENIRVFHQENAGVSAARNHGIQHCNGEYVVFCDSDDAYLENTITEDFIQQIRQMDTDMVCCGYFRIVNNQTVKQGVEPSSDPERIGPNFFRIPYSHHHVCSIFYKKQLLEQYKIRFKEGIKFTEDKVFVEMALYCANSVWHTDHPFYLYIDNPLSVMNTHSEDAFKTLMHSFRVRKWESEVLSHMRSYGAETDAKIEKAVFSLAVGAILEMLQAHFSNNISVQKARKELSFYGLEGYVENHAAYGLHQSIRKEFSLFVNHPYLFAMKYRLRGLCRQAALCLLPQSVIDRIRTRT